MLAEYMLQSILEQNSTMTSLCTDTGPETASPFVNLLIDNSLLYARPDLIQTLLQLVKIVHQLLVYMLLYTFPDAVVDRVEVRAVRWPENRLNTCWCLSTQ